MKRFVMVAVACGALACSTVPRPVPVVGTPSGLSALAGEWNGEYHANGGGRQGTVIFKLAAGADTASGEVLMFPRELPTDAQNGGPNRRPLPQSLAIRFVRAAGDTISGVLDPYIDPDCACRAETLFQGKLVGDAIEGTYRVTRDAADPILGTWRVRRMKP